MPRGELVALLYRQQEEIGILKGIIAELQDKLQQKDAGDDTSSKSVPGFVKANVKKKKHHKARKQRLYNFSRKREQPTETVFHSFSSCPSCGSKGLGQPSVCYSRQIIDIPHRRYEVIEQVVFKRFCFDCLKMVSPKVTFSCVLGHGRIGITLMSEIFTMRTQENMTIHQIQDHLQSVYQLKLSLGEILHQEAVAGTSVVSEIKRALLSSKAIYADETGRRNQWVSLEFFKREIPAPTL